MEKTELIEIKAIGKKSGSKVTFLEIECSDRFIHKVKNDYGLLIEFDDKNMTIHYSENHYETVDVESINDDNLVMFLMQQEQDDSFFYTTCPYWYIQENYNIS